MLLDHMNAHSLLVTTWRLLPCFTGCMPGLERSLKTASLLPPHRWRKSRLDLFTSGCMPGLKRFSGPLCAALVQVTYEEALTHFMGLDLSHLRKDLPKRQRRSMLSMCCGRPQVGWRMYVFYTYSSFAGLHWQAAV